MWWARSTVAMLSIWTKPSRSISPARYSPSGRRPRPCRSRNSFRAARLERRGSGLPTLPRMKTSPRSPEPAANHGIPSNARSFSAACRAPHCPPANNDEPASEPGPPRVSLECAGARCWQDRRQHWQLFEAVGFRARHHVGPPASRHGAGPLQTNTRERGGPRPFAGCERRPAIPFWPLHCPWEQTFMSDDDPVRTWLEELGDSGDPAEAIHLATSGSPAVMSQSLDTCAVRYAAVTMNPLAICLRVLRRSSRSTLRRE